MSELKAKGVDDVYIEYFNTGKHELAQIYLKSEADKAIEDLEESHKKEVGQLLIKIAEQKSEIERLEILCANYIHDCDNIAISNEQVKRAARTLLKKMNHNKYKRCLAMAEMCDARHDEEDTKVNGHGASWEYKSKEMKYWERWHNRWLAIAEKFRPN